MPQRPIEARRPVAPAHAKQPDAETRAAVRLREALPAESPALVELINAVYKPVDWWIFEQLRTDVDEIARLVDDDAVAVIVAEMDGGVVGHVALTMSEGDADAHIGLVAVAREAQGRGVGTLLMAEAERRAGAAGRTETHLHCVRENGLQEYYESLGYAVCGEERGRMWGALHEFTLVEMKKDLR